MSPISCNPMLFIISPFALADDVFPTLSDVTLRSLSPTGGLNAMQVKNRAVFRPVFMALSSGWLLIVGKSCRVAVLQTVFSGLFMRLS